MSLTLQPGTFADYAQLAAFHYRGVRPGPVTRVLTLRHDQPTVVGRFLQRPSETQVVGVLVESLPLLSCRMRQVALPGRYSGSLNGGFTEGLTAGLTGGVTGCLTGGQRAMLLNREMRCISRVVVHPQWRGMGLAVKLVRAALAQPTTIFTEALAAMGRVNPFFAKAGMTAYPRPPHTYDQRLLAVMHKLNIQPAALAMLPQLTRRIAQLPADQRHWLTHELHRWARHHRRRKHDATHDMKANLQLAQRRLLLCPVYYLHDNRPGVGVGCHTG